MKTCVIGFLFFFAGLSCSKAATIVGKVTDEHGQPLAFVNIFPKYSSSGTSTNTDGEYKLELPNGSYELIYKLIGYQLVFKKITIENENIEINVQLKEESYLINEVTVQKNRRDPAYDIIEKAQAKRNYYLSQEIEQFSCRSYVKSLGRVGKVEVKNKLLGIKLFDAPKIPQNSVVYFSETVSEVHYLAPNRYKEKMLHSKVSGQARSYSFATAFAMFSEVNFYKNYLPFGDIYERPFISPIASNSFTYYKYQLIESFQEQGELVHKIKVDPINKRGPVFYGYIYLLEGSWRIHSINLTIDKGTGIDYVDTLNLQQTYEPHTDSIWAIISQKFTFKLSVDLQIAKGNGSGYVVGMFSNYKIKPHKKSIATIAKQEEKPTKVVRKQQRKEKREIKKTFNSELLVVEEDANKLDSASWMQIRPLQLTHEEIKDYHEKDSIAVIKESKIHKDTIDKKQNKFKTIDLIAGYTRRNTYKRERYSFRPMFNNIQFNTMEGWVVNPNFSFRKSYENGRFWEIEPYFRYGFSNTHFNSKLETEFHYNPKKWASIYLEGGKFVQDFNTQSPITPFVNSLYTLLLRENYLKMYEKTYIKVSQGSEWTNGVYISAGAEYAMRHPLDNSTDYSFNTDKSIVYTPNNPVVPGMELFTENKAFLFQLSAKFTFRQKYLTYPNRKIAFGSDYPKLSIYYRKGIPGLFQSDVNFDYISIKAEHTLDLKKVGEADIEAQTGVYLNTQSMYFADYKHFNGNQTILVKSDLPNRFWLLDYYTYSTKSGYVEFHWEHHLNGFITNRIPLLNKLKWQLVNSVNYLYTDQTGNYTEFSVGFEHIFNFFRVDYSASYMQNSTWRQGVRIGMGF